MSYLYSFERTTPETDGYGDTIFDTPENEKFYGDLYSDWTDEDLAEYEAYYDQAQDPQPLYGNPEGE